MAEYFADGITFSQGSEQQHYTITVKWGGLNLSIS